MTSYTLYSHQDMQPVAFSISDLVLASEESLVWVLDQSTAERLRQGERPPIRDLQRHPLAANYSTIGSRDIRDKILVQDPFQRRGPYVLDRQKDSTTRTFRKQPLQGFGRVELVDTHVASDKIPFDRFYFAGEIQEFFLELEEKGYRFEE